MMQCFFMMGLMSVVWALWGYSLAFGGDSPYFGSFTQYFCLNDVTPTLIEANAADIEAAKVANVDLPKIGDKTYVQHIPMSGGIPTSLFMCFQGMFFIITPALICGAFAERMKFSTMCVFLVLWGTFVYCPVCHWVWAEPGWLNGRALDFAGGTVVHISSGVSALVCAIVIGKRMGFGQEEMRPHNLTYTCIGAALLWVGWFGFNAGSAVASNEIAVNAFVATHLCAAAGVLGWTFAEWYLHGRPSILGACSGAIAGLVCITPAAGSCTPMVGILMGLIAGVGCFWGCTTLKNKLGYDDSLDAFGIHGLGGTIGALLTGVFATAAVDGVSQGLLEGNPVQLWNQVLGILATATLAAIVTFILLKVLDATMGLRVTQEDEVQGLDLSEHGEEGYIFL
jgi:Amt family ammonium transporter